MEIESLISALNKIYPITPEAAKDLNALMEVMHLERNEYLVRSGSRAHFCYALMEGVVRVYYDKDGNEYNKTFFTAGMFPTPLTSLLAEEPCLLSFQALLPCQLVRFSYRGFRSLCNRHRCLESLLLRIMEQVWIDKERHDIQMVTNDATRNYLIFREEYPDLESLIPQYHIASYLGITPIQLSRIRAQLAKTN